MNSLSTISLRKEKGPYSDSEPLNGQGSGSNMEMGIPDTIKCNHSGGALLHQGDDGATSAEQLAQFELNNDMQLNTPPAIVHLQKAYLEYDAAHPKDKRKVFKRIALEWAIIRDTIQGPYQRFGDSIVKAIQQRAELEMLVEGSSKNRNARLLASLFILLSMFMPLAGFCTYLALTNQYDEEMLEVKVGEEDYQTCLCNNCDCACSPLNPHEYLGDSGTFLRCEADLKKLLNITTCADITCSGEGDACRSCIDSSLSDERVRHLTASDINRTSCSFQIQRFETKCEAVYGLYKELDPSIVDNSDWTQPLGWAQYIPALCSVHLRYTIADCENYLNDWIFTLQTAGDDGFKTCLIFCDQYAFGIDPSKRMMCPNVADVEALSIQPWPFRNSFIASVFGLYRVAFEGLGDERERQLGDILQLDVRTVLENTRTEISESLPAQIASQNTVKNRNLCTQKASVPGYIATLYGTGGMCFVMAGIAIYLLALRYKGLAIHRVHASVEFTDMVLESGVDVIIDWVTVFTDVWKRLYSRQIWVKWYIGTTLVGSATHIAYLSLSYHDVRRRYLRQEDSSYMLQIVRANLWICDFLQAVFLIGLVWHEELQEAGMIYADLAIKAMSLMIAVVPALGQFWFDGRFRRG